MMTEETKSLHDPRPPWLSEKVWLAFLGLAAIVVLGTMGVIQVAGAEIVGIVAALILGRAWEGVAATNAENR